MRIVVDYDIEVICDGTRLNRDHARQLVTRIAHRSYVPSEAHPNTRMFGWLRWVELVPADGEKTRPRAMQTMFGEIKRHKELGLSEAEARHRGPDAGVRWRFECEQCKDTLPVRHEVMGPVLEGLRALKRESVTLAEVDDLAERVRNAARMSQD